MEYTDVWDLTFSAEWYQSVLPTFVDKPNFHREHLMFSWVWTEKKFASSDGKQKRGARYSSGNRFTIFKYSCSPITVRRLKLGADFGAK